MKALRKFKNFVDEITQENGRNYKISILEKYKEDEDIKYFLHFVFSPYIVTGISDKKLHKSLSYSATDYEDKNIVSVYDLLEYIKVNNTGTDNVLKTVNAFININQDFPADLCELIDKIITKNLPLGIDSKTINKVIPGLIPEFQVMLANKYFDNPKIVEGKEFAITTKIDGMRCIMIKENDEVSFWSRQGQKIEGLVDIAKEAEALPNDICLDCELVAIVDSPDTYKQTMQTARTKDAEKHGLKLKVFDWLPAEDFKNQSSSIPYYERRAKLEEIFKDANLYKFMELLPVLYQGTDVAKIAEFLKQAVDAKCEGIMLNNINAPYRFKRTNDLLKVKLMKDLDLEVIGFEEGDNKLSGTLGALLVDYAGNVVKVGSGLSEELRSEIWNNKDEWLGRTVVVQYFEETKNADGGVSLRFPVYIDYREDK